jgi:hypothetical protein
MELMVHVTGLVEDLGVLELDVLFWVETVDYHYQLIGLSKMDAWQYSSILVSIDHPNCTMKT